MQRRNIDPTSLAEIGARLKLSRLALGKTQAEMASYMGSSTPGQAWENYEAGRRRISIDHALALRSVGLTIEWIYEGNDRRLSRDLYARIKQQIAYSAPTTLKRGGRR